MKDLAATYSRARYTCTTIGNAAFDGRVRNGNGSVHCFKATKKLLRNGVFSENYMQIRTHFVVQNRFPRCFFQHDNEEKAIKPHDRLVSVR